MHPQTSIAALGVAFALIACGSDVTPIPFDQFVPTNAATACDYLFRCCDATELRAAFTGASPPVTTEPQCVTFVASAETSLLPDESIAAGRVTYDATAAAECDAARRGAACGEIEASAAAACAHVFVGHVVTGGACRDAGDCTGAQPLCDGGTAATFGVCVERAALGASCADVPCRGDGHCDATHVCVALKANGAACGSDGECATFNCDSSTNVCSAVPATCDGA